MKQIIKTLLYEWKEKRLPNIIHREIDLARYLSTPKKIVIISGFRRVGKTYLSFQLINNILDKKDKEEIIYINFEDERIPIKTEFLTELIPIIKETFDKKIYAIFLDEIQVIDDWSKWLRRIYDNNDFFIFVTGSSSKLSLKEIPTELRGRFVNIEILPLSFKEFLKFKNFSFDKKSLGYLKYNKAKLFNLLDEYLKFGGLPEVVLLDEGKKTETIQNYYKTVVNRDIIERFKVKNEEGIKSLLRLLINSTSYSLTKLYNILKSSNVKIGKTVLMKYINYIENSYFMESLHLFSYKIKNQLQYPRKVYFIDNGFITSLSLNFSNNFGKLYENIMFIELKRRRKINQDLYYWASQNKEEVDFVVKEGFKIKQLIQVCYNINDYDTKKREVRSLIKASKELKCNNLLVITEDYENLERIKNKKIKFIPLWKWLLDL